MQTTDAVNPGLFDFAYTHWADCKYKDSLNDRSIELAGVAWNLKSAYQRRLREDHGPWHSCWPAPQLSIDKVGDAAKRYAKKTRGCDRIQEQQGIDPAAPCETPDRDDQSRNSTMTGHTSMPNGEDLQRVASNRRSEQTTLRCTASTPPGASDTARCVQTCVSNGDISRQRLLPLWELKIHDFDRGHRYRPTGRSVWTITPALHRVERGIAQQRRAADHADRSYFAVTVDIGA
jgi:hypothetical protein